MHWSWHPRQPKHSSNLLLAAHSGSSVLYSSKPDTRCTVNDSHAMNMHHKANSECSASANIMPSISCQAWPVAWISDLKQSGIRQQRRTLRHGCEYGEQWVTSDQSHWIADGANPTRHKEQQSCSPVAFVLLESRLLKELQGIAVLNCGCSMLPLQHAPFAACSLCSMLPLQLDDQASGLR